MRGLLRYPVAYLLGVLRERVTPEDFAGQAVTRVLVCGEGMEPVARRLFPEAAPQDVASLGGLWAVRRARFDAACIAMTGGEVGPRMRGLLAGARHTLLVPSPDYVYRLGVRGSLGARVAAWADRLLVSPLALVWLGVVTLLMVATGLTRAASLAQRQAGSNPLRVLVIRLLPTPLLVRLLRRLREEWPPLHLTVVIASAEGAEELEAEADEVICTAGLGASAARRRLREAAPEVAVVAGGAGYGLSPTYLKAVLLARLCGAPARWQWEPGQEIPGQPLNTARWPWASTLRRPERGRLSWLARCRQRGYYRRPPTRGPRLVQIGLSEACNYHCVMCAFHNPAAEAGHREADLPKMSRETFAQLLTDLERLGTEALDICGNGEPLTNPHAMEMIALARERGFEVTLATNAGLLTEARAQALVDLGLRRMHASINAGSEEVYARMHPGTPPGAFLSIVTRLREMAEYAERTGQRPIDVEYSAVLTRLNMHEIVAMVEAAHEARAGWLMLIRMGPVEGAEALMPRPEDWEAIREEVTRAKGLAKQYGIVTNLAELEAVASPAGTRSIYEEIPCYVGSEFALVFASGMVNFCCHCYYLIGNVNEAGFAGVWNSERYQRLREQAMSLPETRCSLESCGCFHSCSHLALNVEIHARLHGRNVLRGKR
jgi:MoaA/NifB/PqqE/SkfB family radical SAM enzyme